MVVFFSPSCPIIGLAGDPPSLQWQGTAALGPIVIENIPRKEHLREPPSWSPAGGIYTTERCVQNVSFGTLHWTLFCSSSSASTSSTALVCELGTALALVVLAFMGAFICSRTGKPKDYTVCT